MAITATRHGALIFLEKSAAKFPNLSLSSQLSFLRLPQSLSKHRHIVYSVTN